MNIMDVINSIYIFIVEYWWIMLILIFIVVATPVIYLVFRLTQYYKFMRAKDRCDNDELLVEDKLREQERTHRRPKMLFKKSLELPHIHDELPNVVEGSEIDSSSELSIEPTEEEEDY